MSGSRSRCMPAFLPRIAILAVLLVAGSGATTIASAWTECYFTACETLSDGSKLCVTKQVACPPTNT